MSRAFRFCLAVFVAAPLAIGALPVRDQKDSGQAVRESASVTLIEIPVNVIGKDGKPVAGLTASDFELYDDEQKQVISGLETVDLAHSVSVSSQAGAGLSPSLAAARRHWLIVFDLSFTSLSGILRARDGAQQFVAKAMKGSDFAAVATLSVDTGWRLLVNFTADRKQLAQAIDTLGLPSLAAQSADPLGFAYAPPGQNPYSFARGRFDGDINDTLKDLQLAQKPATDDLARGRVMQFLKSLGAMGRTLDAVRGRKHVLLFSEGFETRLLSGNAADKASGTPYVGQQTAAQDASTASVEGEVWKVDSDARFGSTSTRSSLTGALAQLRRSDTILHTIDIGGLRSESDSSSSAKPGSGTDALFTLAAETNGEFVRNANQLGAEIEKIVERTDLVYLLVYQPKSLARPGAFHRLRVKVNAPGAKVVARSGYFEPKPYAALSPIERVLLAADAITGGVRENAFSTAVLAAPFPAGESLAQVPVVIEIPGASLLKDDTAEKSRIQVFVYATDMSGTLADYLTQEMGLDMAKLRSRLEGAGIQFVGTLALPPGDYILRTFVRNGETGRSALTKSVLKVNAVPGVTPVVLPPFFREPPGQWIVVKANSRVDSPVRYEESPFTIEGETFIPTAVPSLDQGAAVDVVVTAFNFGSGKKMEPLQVSSEIVGTDGKAQPVELQILRRFDHQRAEGRVLLLSFKPNGLAAGHYTLKLRVVDRPTKKASEASADFELRTPKS